MSIPSYNTDLGHLALVMVDADFMAVNGGIAYTKTVNPGPGLAPEALARRRQLSGTTLVSGELDTVLVINHYISQEAQRVY